MTAFPETILVIAKSARMLVRFLNDSGYRVVAIDCFGDLDSRETALDYCRVASLALADIREPVLAMKNRYALRFVIYGSGFERYLASLCFLQTQLSVLGNSLCVFGAVQNKAYFFDRLDKLGIEHPAVSFQRPVADRQWLIKPLAGEGGLNVRKFQPISCSGVESVYWQHYIQGVAMSVLFVATQNRAVILGFQRQLLCDNEPSRHFQFAGVISSPELPVRVQSTIVGWVERITEYFRLKGLNGLDFILQNERCYALEINARPPASLQLYGPEVIEAHMSAVLSRTVDIPIRSPGWLGYKIIYAGEETRIGGGIEWPAWALDRPIAESRIDRGEPICSIIARAKSRRKLMECLHNQHQVIEKLLTTGS